jgi:hypothetical protein
MRLKSYLRSELLSATRLYTIDAGLEIVEV